MRYVLLGLALILVGTNLAQAQIPNLSELTRTVDKIMKTSDDTARVAKVHQVFRWKRKLILAMPWPLPLWSVTAEYGEMNPPRSGST